MTLRRAAALFLFACVTIPFAAAQSVDSTSPQSSPFAGALHWRNIGPYRGGRTRAVSGVIGDPKTYYLAQVNGGIFKTDDIGRTWQPIFDSQPTASIGSLAVAPSDANVIYAGSGEGLYRPDLSVGDGIYRSRDAGKTWTHLGLRDGQQIPQIAVDPRDANRILVAVAGHPYGPNPERGIFRSTDGGQTFEKVLFKNENVGASDVLFDPQNPDIAYAALWESREGPWENGAWDGTGGGIFKSTDNGKSWNQLTGGLPAGIIQSNIGISRSDPARLLATVATSDGVHIYRTDDSGVTWRVITKDARPASRIGGGDLSVPRFDPKNPDTVYIASTVTWKSTDGGVTWTGFRGAPGGDDYQNIWINPDDPQNILLGSDQGAIITVNGGRTWSSWYNQSTAQMYHVSADNAFPYRLCGGQQESGSACVASRGDDGEITMRDWHPVAAEEYGYVVPDPLDPDIIYGGKLTRYDRRTDQAQNILPDPLRGKGFRVVRTEPIVFAPNDPHTFYFASNTLWRTSDAGRTWKQVSPDLTRRTFDVPASVGEYRSQPTAQPKQRGVIYSVAISPLQPSRIWAGTDDGLIHITDDAGAHWRDVTPPQLAPFKKVAGLEAGHFDKDTAYAAINTLRLDDLHPLILRTTDAGKTWTPIVNGITENENVNAVREDPTRKGLLYAATERGVWLSFDDGASWQSLRLNLPATSMRDIIVKGDDLAVATHGRGFWILDDITPVRQFKGPAISADTLFKPEVATRIRWDLNTDTPLPPDFPAGENPPDGAVIDYALAADSSSPVVLEVRDAAGKVLRRFSSSDSVPQPDPKLAIPQYWVRPPQVLSNKAGIHRFTWDMHLDPVPQKSPDYPIAAVYRNTVPTPVAPWVLPGTYTIALTADGKTMTQPLTVKLDPRVKITSADLTEQFAVSNQVYEDIKSLAPAADSADIIISRIKQLMADPKAAALKPELLAFQKKFSSVAGGEERGPGPAASDVPTVAGTYAKLLQIFGILQEVDAAPTSQAKATVDQLHASVPNVLKSWTTLQSDINEVNGKLKAAGLAALTSAQ